MGVLWMEGGEVRTTELGLQRSYENVVFPAGSGVTTGRFFGNALEGGPGSGGLSFDFTPTHLDGGRSTLYVHLSLYIHDVNPTQWNLLTFTAGATEQLTLRVDDVGTGYKLGLYRGVALLAETGEIPNSSWHTIELMVTFHPSAGAYELRINESTEFSGSGVNTDPALAFEADRIKVRVQRNTPSTDDAWIDDIVVYDDQSPGPGSSGFVGLMIVEEKLADAAGALAEFTPSAGSNYQNVDEANEPDDDTTYNVSDAVSERDLYGYGNISTIDGTIRGVIIETRAKLESSGSRELRALYRDPTSSTVSEGDSVDVDSTSYAGKVQRWDENPVTTAPFSITDIDSGQFGVKAQT